MAGIAIREAYGKALADLGEVDGRVVALDADVSNSTRTIYFAERFPERFYNLGIAEANMMSIAAGLAACGWVPFVNTFSFLTALRAADPVRSLVAYNNLNVKIAGNYAGLSDSYDGASHQSINDIAIMRSLPNMTVVVVADAVETRMAVAKVAEHAGPVFLRLSRAEVPVIFTDDHPFEIGRGNLLREGCDVTIIATGYMVCKALDAARLLEADGISAEVIEIHTIKPIDSEIIGRSARKTGAVVTAEEHSVIGGLGSAVAEVLAARCPTKMAFVGVKDTFAESGDYEPLLEKYGLSSEAIVEAVERMLSKECRPC